MGVNEEARQIIADLSVGQLHQLIATQVTRPNGLAVEASVLERTIDTMREELQGRLNAATGFGWTTMERNGLRPGQEWKVAPGPAWQARLGRDGRAHVIGEGLAMAEGYQAQYLDPRRPMVSDAGYMRRFCRVTGVPVPPAFRGRRWHGGEDGFTRACRAAALHERMVRRWSELRSTRRTSRSYVQPALLGRRAWRT